MITAHVWLPSLGYLSDVSVGHASIGFDSGTDYISWWPGETKKHAASKLAKVAVTLEPKTDNDVDPPYYLMDGFKRDKELMGKCPDVSADIGGLDEEAIRTFWSGLQSKPLFSIMLDDNRTLKVSRDPRDLGMNPIGSWRFPRRILAYHPLYFNCCHVVYLCLVAGGLFYRAEHKMSFFKTVFAWTTLQTTYGLEYNFFNGDITDVPFFTPGVLASLLREF